MYIIDKVRTSAGGRVKLPLYHRGHLSLYPGTTIYLAPVLREEGSRGRFPEVLGTTIHRSSWSTLFRISVSMRDAPGVLYTVLDSIASHGGNILNLDSVSTDQETFHNVELVVDFAAILELDNPAQDPCAEIEGILLADCCKHVVEEPGIGFGIRVRPHRSLRRLHSALAKVRANKNQRLIQESRIGRDGLIQIERPLTRLTLLGFPNIDRFPDTFGYFVTSDTKERIFRITLVPDKTTVVWCSIGHNDRPGALAAITDEIRQKGITVLAALNRMQRHHGRCWFEAILSKSSWGGDAVTPREEVLEALDDETLQASFAPRAYFSREDADGAMQAQEDDEFPPASWRLARETSLRDWLKEKEDLARHLQSSGSDDETRLAVQQASLKAGINRVREAHGQLRPRLFVSLEFTESNLARIETIRDCCISRNVELDVVKDTEEQPVVREEVLARIGQANLFIGVWTPSKKDPASTRCSPWLPWELGVASALRLPFGILIDKRADTIDFKATHPEIYYFPFSSERTGDFKRRFTTCLDRVLESAIAQRSYLDQRGRSLI